MNFLQSDTPDGPARLLTLERIEKRFGGVHALKGVSFDLNGGEVHALVGENGAGKSTLIKIVAGAVATNGGSIWYRGQIVERMTPALSRSLGIAVIYQQPALFPDLTVAENLAFARDAGRLNHLADWRTWNRRAARVLEEVGAKIRPHDPAGSLTMPEQQLVEIAKALDADAKVLVMDEPTASLGEREADNLLRIVRQLRTRNVGIIYISHRLEEVYALADRITVLRDGQSVGTFDTKELARHQLIHMMVGRQLETMIPAAASLVGAPVLEVEELSNPSRRVHSISFVLHRGEVLGLAGLVGAGRTQFAETLFGLTPAASGLIRIDGVPVRIESPQRAVRLGLAYVPEDRRKHGVIMGLSVSQNTTLASLKNISRAGFLLQREEFRAAEEYRSRFQIKTESLLTPVEQLSGGNQQKVAIGRWLMTRPRVLILDEPTQGVDIGAKAEIYAVIRELAAEGLAILLISSEMPEVIGISDRLLVMRDGRIAGVLGAKDATANRVMELAVGHTAPVA
jgi:rhamnose transport system ATP-binding protein